ncbi:hypothetical protein CERSUDRAFT_110272 [Gelatoporia subvermispora B]|uniref:RBR-type E3 ubiquitin transferase n=1 Tax=Ceriporiopsis subvermispora (strain B) TaxID=914234 RepID=M2RTC2_CERS8|nr:hypothetical protein CERSUDRAFT_110272 [Gelatoporia subvermispora B]
MSASSSTSTRRHGRYYQESDVFSSLFTYIANLGLDDLDELESHSKNTRRDGTLTSSSAPLSDEELALQLFWEEAQPLLSIAKDFLVGGSRVEDDSQTLLDEFAAVEEMARLDHEMAIALSEGRDPPPRLPPIPISRSPFLSHVVDFSSDIDARHESDDTAVISRSPSPDSSTTTSTHSTPATSPTVSVTSLPEDKEVVSRVLEACTACGDNIDDTVLVAPCGHAYDIPCIETMFRMATVDESAYPPRCCQKAIALADVREHLSSRLVDTFETKSVEFGTPNRVYCYRAACSKFLGAKLSEPCSMTCSACFAVTCGGCKLEAHPGQGCSARMDQPVLDLAKEQKWQRCPTCQHVVELTVGCYHMECICKSQFCYLCGAAWKKCPCPQFAVPPELQD